MSKIYIAAEFIAPRCGLGNYLTELVEHLQQSKPDVEVVVRTVANLWDNGEPSEPAQVTAKNYKQLLKKILPEKMVIAINRQRTSLYYNTFIKYWNHIPNDSVCILPHIALSRLTIPYYKSLLKKDLVWVIHDLHPFYFPESWDREAVEVSHKFLPYMAQQCKHIIVHNDFTKESVKKFLRVDDDKISVIKLPPLINVLNDERNLDKERKVLSNYGIKKPYALWSSSSTFVHKNHERLIKAWQIVQKKFPTKVQLVCTGSKEPNWDGIESLLKPLREEIDVIFTGSIPRSELISILNNADLAVCPTLFEGGGSGPALEATLAEVPLACSNIPQVREQYDSRNDLCTFFDGQDINSIAWAVLEILNNPVEARQKAKNASHWIQENRTWQETAANYHKVIGEFLSVHKELL